MKNVSNLVFQKKNDLKFLMYKMYYKTIFLVCYNFKYKFNSKSEPCFYQTILFFSISLYQTIIFVSQFLYLT